MSEVPDDDKDDPYYETKGANLQKTLIELADILPKDATVPVEAFIKLGAGLIALRDSLTPIIEVLFSLDLDESQRKKLVEVGTPLMVFTESIGDAMKVALGASDEDSENEVE